MVVAAAPPSPTDRIAPESGATRWLTAAESSDAAIRLARFGYDARVREKSPQPPRAAAAPIPCAPPERLVLR